MTLKHYFPISVAVFVLAVVAAHSFAVPVAPFALILLVGETLLGFQVEDHKAARFVGDLLRKEPANRAH